MIFICFNPTVGNSAGGPADFFFCFAGEPRKMFWHVAHLNLLTRRRISCENDIDEYERKMHRILRPSAVMGHCLCVHAEQVQCFLATNLTSNFGIRPG